MSTYETEKNLQALMLAVERAFEAIAAGIEATIADVQERMLEIAQTRTPSPNAQALAECRRQRQELITELEAWAGKMLPRGDADHAHLMAELRAIAGRVEVNPATVLPSTAVLEIAVLWASGKPMLMTQLGALARWVSDREGITAEQLAEVLRLSPAQARNLIELAARAPRGDG